MACAPFCFAGLRRLTAPRSLIDCAHVVDHRAGIHKRVAFTAGMKKPSVLVIFLTVFIDLIGFGIVLPLLPTYGEEYGASGFTIGAIIASFSVMQFLFAPVWGRWSDRIGRRPVILISTFGSVVSYGMFALSAWPAFSPRMAVTVLLASRVFAGACGANISVASAYIADITPPESRSKGMGLIGAAFGLGFLIGPPLGSESAKWFGLAGPGWVAAGLCLFNFLLACVTLLESRTPGSEHAADRPRLAQWGHVLRQPKVGLLVLLYALSTFSFVCYECTLPLLLGSPSFHPDDFKDPPALSAKLTTGSDPVSQHLRAKLTPEFLAELKRAEVAHGPLQRRLCLEFNRQIESAALLDGAVRSQIPERAETKQVAGRKKQTSSTIKHLNRLLLEDAYPGEIKRQTLYYDRERIGYIFMFCGLVSVFIQGGVIGRIVKRFGEPRVILGSLVIIAASLPIIPYVGTLAMLLVALGLFSIGSGINRAPTMGMISMYSPPGEQGATMGVAQSAGTLARVVGPMMAVPLYWLHPHSPYLLATGVAAVAGFLAWRYLSAPDKPGVTKG
jgi:MFS family permease